MTLQSHQITAVFSQRQFLLKTKLSKFAKVSRVAGLDKLFKAEVKSSLCTCIYKEPMESFSLNLNLTKNQQALLNRAVGVALTSEQKYRLGAILVKKGKAVSVGINIRRNHPNIVENPLSESGVCAEREAIRKAGHNAEGATLYVARVGKCGDPLLAKPCSRCVEAIRKAKIKRVIFTL